MKPRLIPTAEPFLLPGGATGCLVVHGFTGTPKEMRWLGDALNEKGHTVLGIRLAGHATQLKDMVRTRKEDWLASVEDGWHLLQGMCDNIFVIGLSLGGVLSLVIASTHKVAGVAALSTPFSLPDDPRIPFIKPISLVQPMLPKGEPDWHDPQASSDHVCYPMDPTRSYAEVRDLLKEMRKSLPLIHAPALLVYSREDQTVRAEDQHAERILAALGSREKTLVWVENSGHVITRDAARQEVFLAVCQFVDCQRAETA